MSSLVDALLLDPWRDPHDIYIALRADGQRGSGTADDPYDGGAHVGSSIPADLSFNPREVIVRAYPRESQTAFTQGETVRLLNLLGYAAADYGGVLTLSEKLDDLHWKALLPASPPSPGQSPPRAPADPRPNLAEAINYLLKRCDGSGNLADEPGYAVQALCWPVATVGTDSPHGLQHFDVATVAGAEDIAFHAESYVLVPSTNAQKFYYRLRGSGELPDAVTTPVDCTFARHTYRFDEAMAAVPGFSRVRIGPGLYPTRGGLRWFARNGQCLSGAGLGQTTLRLEHAWPVGPVPIVISYPDYISDGFECFDLTLDCNLSGQLPYYNETHAVACCAGVEVRGNHIRLRRLRAIRFGTQIPASECFVLGCGWTSGEGPPVNRVIEDCVLEKPNPNNVRETTLLAVVGSGLVPEAQGGIVRHCYVNLTYPPTEAHPEGFSSALVGIESAAQDDSQDWGAVTITTLRPHGMEPGQLAVLNGVDMIGPGKHPLNGVHPIESVIDELIFICRLHLDAAFTTPIFTYAVLGVHFQGGGALSGTGCVIQGNAFYDVDRVLYSDTGSTRDVVVRDNYIYGALQAVWFDFSTGGVYGEQRAAEILWEPSPGNELIATYVLADGQPDLGIVPGDAVTIAGVRIETSPGNFESALDGTYNGSFNILSVSTDRREFKYVMRIQPEFAPADPETDFPIRSRARYQVRRMLYEGNICALTPHDTNPSGFPFGVGSYAPGGVPMFMFPGGLIRENVFGFVDTPSPTMVTNQRCALASLFSFRDTVIDGNVTSFDGNFTGADRPAVVRYRQSYKITAFNNLSPAGGSLALFEVLNDDGDLKQRDTIEEKILDALTLALL